MIKEGPEPPRSNNAPSTHQQLSFKQFESLAMPAPVGDKKYIILLIHNAPDGVGDFVHGQEFAKIIKNLTEKQGYKVCAVIQSELATSSARIKFMKDRLEKSQDCFDTYFFLNEGSTFNIDAHPELKKVLHQSACALDVSYAFSLDLKNNLSKDIPVVKCYQFGEDISVGGNFDVFKNAHMGLNLTNPECYGIPLKDLPTGEAEDLLLTIEDKLFVQMLCNKKKPSKEDGKAYFDSRHMFPGYLQSKAAATAFVISNLLRYINNGKIEKGCDFFLPKGMVDEELLRRYLKSLNIDPSEIQFINENSEPSQSGKIPSCRIFTGFNLNDSDYAKLYQFSNDVAGCSGDNSAALVISSHSLPFIQTKGTRRRGGALDIFYDDLGKCVDLAIKRASNDKEMINNLNVLKEYFEHMLNCSWLLFDDLRLDNNTDKLEQWCNKLATLLQNDNLKKAWQYTREIIKSEYDYRDNLSSILKGALYLAQPQSNSLIVKRCLVEVQALRNLVDKKILTKEQTERLTLDDCILFAHRNFNQLLLEYDISPEQLLHEKRDVEKNYLSANSYEKQWSAWVINDFIDDMKTKYKKRDSKPVHVAPITVQASTLRLKSFTPIMPKEAMKPIVPVLEGGSEKPTFPHKKKKL